MNDIDVMRSHASFVEARCEDGATVARDMRAMAAEVERLRHDNQVLLASGCPDGAWVPVDVVQEVQRQRDKAEAKVARLTEALRELYDLQNGPPLMRERERWHRAMVAAAEILQAAQAAGGEQ